MKITEDFNDISKVSVGNFVNAYRNDAERADNYGTAHASFSFGGKATGSYANCFNKACHNYLRYMTSDTYWLVNYFVRSTKFIEAENFLSYLTSGPYKNAVSDAIFYKEKGVTRYMAWDHVAERDIKLLANFLIATRLISEFNAGKLWRYLLESGFSDDTAFILLTCCSYDYSTGDMQGYLGMSGDLPLSPQCKGSINCKYLDPLRLYKRTPLPGATLKNGGNSYLCNYIWGGRDTPVVILQDKHRYSHDDGKGNKGMPYSKTMEKINVYFKKNEKVPSDYVKEIEETLRNGGQIA